jgi:hypothetical protein
MLEKKKVEKTLIDLGVKLEKKTFNKRFKILKSK